VVQYYDAEVGKIGSICPGIMPSRQPHTGRNVINVRSLAAYFGVNMVKLRYSEPTDFRLSQLSH
jgi:hypothetical protein